MRDRIHLLSPLVLGALPLPNRIIAAFPVAGGADDGGTPQPRILPDYARAAAGASLVIAEPAWVAPQGMGAVRSPGIARDAHVAAWSAVTDAVHGAGGRIALPLWHAGRRAHPRVQPHRGWPVGPSAVAAPGEAETPDGLRPHPEPRALEASELPSLVEAFAMAADRAGRAGFDAVEIHAAGDGLIEQFLRSDSNRRADAYGVSQAGGARLLLEVVAAVAARIGADRVGVRLAASDTPVAALLAGRGLAWLHADVGEGARVPVLRSAFDGPIILGGDWSTAAASGAIADGAADAVALAPTSGLVNLPPHTTQAGPTLFLGGLCVAGRGFHRLAPSAV